MGFWSSLVHSVVQVTHWVSNNSGSIAEAAGMIAKVAGAVLLTDEELIDEGDNGFPTLKANLDKAQTKLLAKATAVFAQPTILSGQTLNIIDLPALWPTPATGEDPKTIPEISMDINKLLASERIPVTLQNQVTGETVDVGNQIANQIFNSRGVSVYAEESLHSNEVDIEYNGKPLIAGGMVYYKIPLGNRGYEAWHSHIRLYYISSPENEKHFREHRRSLAIRQNLQGVKMATGPYNSATLSVQWTGSHGVAPIMTKAVQQMLSDEDNILFTGPAIIDGTRFKYQFRIPVEQGPAEIAAKLSRAITKSLPKVGVDNGTPRMPTVKVSNLQTFI